MIHKHTISVKHALSGAMWAFKTQPNYKIHGSLSLLSLLGAWVLRISYTELLTILTLIFIGFSLETVNTAIEQTSDAIDDKWREDIKTAKDVAAGAMLMFAVGAFVIACVIFLPKLAALFF